MRIIYFSGVVRGMTPLNVTVEKLTVREYKQGRGAAGNVLLQKNHWMKVLVPILAVPVGIFASSQFHNSPAFLAGCFYTVACLIAVSLVAEYTNARTTLGTFGGTYPLTYSFGDDGIAVTSDCYTASYSWSAVYNVSVLSEVVAVVIKDGTFLTIPRRSLIYPPRNLAAEIREKAHEHQA